MFWNLNANKVAATFERVFAKIYDALWYGDILYVATTTKCIRKMGDGRGYSERGEAGAPPKTPISSFTPSGISALVRLVQPAKAYPPKLIALLGIDTLFRPEQ